MTEFLSKLVRRNSTRYGLLFGLAFAVGLALMLDWKATTVTPPVSTQFEKSVQTPLSVSPADNNITITADTTQNIPPDAGTVSDASEIPDRFPRRPGPTSEWAIRIAPGSNIESVARQLGGISLGGVANLKDTYLIYFPGGVDRKDEISSALGDNPEVLWYEQQIAEE